jgi:hypothetical protein
MDVNGVADVSEVHASPIFRIEGVYCHEEGGNIYLRNAGKIAYINAM